MQTNANQDTVILYQVLLDPPSTYIYLESHNFYHHHHHYLNSSYHLSFFNLVPAIDSCLTLFCFL